MSKYRILQKETFLSAINNSVGSMLFRDLWAEDENGEVKNLTNGGELSCAVYVSWMLRIFGLIDEPKATVKNLMAKLIEAGWEEVKPEEIEAGDIIEWERNSINSGHSHVGFYVGEQKTVSNSTKLRKIVKHGWDFGGRRKIVKILRWRGW